MERDYATRIYQLKEQLTYRPGDAGLRLELARVYYDFTRSGLLDPSLEDYYWEMTLAQLFEAMRFESSRQDMVVDLARLLQMRQMYQEAELIVEDVLRKEPAHLEARLLLLECLTERAQLEGDSSLLQQARKRALESAWAVKLQKRHPLFNVVQYWFGRSHA
ncbi:MAG: hypothetical protein KF760_33300 [Candidatus Eremiobacteraeota bacterium]|nr:hypothetical protein [Candidatus Eremiobacteraeota bacterium]MCW5869083.1 hypothetical protein [Candidatus Eremiobacteraeota bacterium]